jgi:hypothetical protein
VSRSLGHVSSSAYFEDGAIRVADRAIDAGMTRALRPCR